MIILLKKFYRRRRNIDLKFEGVGNSAGLIVFSKTSKVFSESHDFWKKISEAVDSKFIVMAGIVRLAKLVHSVDTRIKELEEFTKLPVFTGQHLDSVNDCTERAAVDAAMQKLQHHNETCQNSVDQWDLTLRELIGIGGIPPLDDAIQKSREAVEGERRKRSENLEKRAKFHLLIGRNPDFSNEYRRALASLEADIKLELQVGANNILRCFQTFKQILKMVLDVIVNPPPPPETPDSKPPPPGMYV